MKQTKQSPKIKNVWDWVKCINTTKEHPNEFSDADWKHFNAWTIHKAISQNRDFIEIVGLAQRLDLQKVKDIYMFYREFIPYNKGWYGFVKKQTKGPNKELLRIIASYFEFGEREAFDYINVLEKDEVKQILISMGFEKKEITKLLKK